MLLLSGFEKTSAQTNKDWLIPAMRKANETKLQLDSCKAFGLIVTNDRNAYLDSTRQRNASMKKLIKTNARIEKGRNNWRLVSTILIIFTTISTVL